MTLSRIASLIERERGTSDSTDPTTESGSDESTSAQLIWALSLLVLVGAMAVYVPTDLSPWWLPRVAVAWIVAPIGVVIFVRRSLAGCRASWAALAFLVWAAIGALVSDAPRIALIGAIDRPGSVLFIGSALGAWAIGASLGVGRRDQIGPIVVLLGLLSAEFALIQLFVNSNAPGMGLSVGRPVGLAGFPIYFGAHMGACAAWFLHRMSSRFRWVDVAGFACFASAAALSGSRIATVALLVLVVYALVKSRQATVAIAIPMWFAGLWVARVMHSWAGTERSVGDRLDGRGLGERIDVWLFGAEGFFERPILGHGVGRFHAAAVDHYSDAFVARWGGSSDFTYRDAHNVFVEYLVTTGVVGLLLLVAFGVLVGRRATGPLAWMSAVIVVTWFFEAAAPPTAPLVALLVGVAVPRPAEAEGPPEPSTVQMLAVGGVGVAVSVWMFIGAASLDDRLDEPTPPGFGASQSYFTGDPVAAEHMWFSNLRISDDPTDPDDPAASAMDEWLEHAVAWEPDVPAWRWILANRYFAVGRLDEAALVAEEAFAIQPNHANSFRVLRAIADEVGDDDAAADYEERLCELGVVRYCRDDATP